MPETISLTEAVIVGGQDVLRTSTSLQESHFSVVVRWQKAGRAMQQTSLLKQ
eukprot:COSAG02_NODE_34832_length_477_cov_1.772487_1_plen_51_part_10